MSTVKQNLFNRKFYLILAFIFLAELFSLFGYLLPAYNVVCFFIIVVMVLCLSLYKLEYGLWILLAELFIGSKGYLFFFEYGGLTISIRIALWLIIMAVWLGVVISNFLKTKKIQIELFKSPYFSYFLILFIFITWGLINGFLNKNAFNNIFFDFNGWLYFALIFPIYSVVGVFNKAKKAPKQDNTAIGGEYGGRYDTTKYQSGTLATDSPINIILQIFTASIIWLSFKTFFLFFIFSHNMTSMVSQLYHWVRITGVGEITQMQGGFYRIFFQSHIFVLIGFFVFAMLLVSYLVSKCEALKNSEAQSRLGEKIFLFTVVCLLLTVILISFSRSFWTGLIAGLLILGFSVVMTYNWKILLKITGLLLLSFIISFGFIVAMVKFPYPKPLGGFNTTELLSERASTITGEAAVSSRWTLLPILSNKIKQAPILGQGFGATVTYSSSDPRILQSSPSGKYTTYALEWGWLDIWLKLGLFGLLAYLILISKLFYNGLKLIKNKELIMHNITNIGFLVGLAVITIVNFFTPYLNHPLGIGYIIIVSAILSQYKTT